jgi:undecaprenyl-diphosphatase
MLDFLNSIDTAVFYFINKTLANPVTDKLMPFITENNHWTIFYVIILLYLLIKGGAKGRVAVILLLILIFITDQSTNFLKELFERLRPCKALTDVNLLVGCNSMYGLPSNHAVNNFAAATLFSHFYPNFTLVLYLTASIMALARVFVGVHYPFDVIAGAVWGSIVALILIALWNLLNSKLKILK